MSQRVIRGPSSRKPMAVVREHGDRMEVICLSPSTFTVFHEMLADYWGADDGKVRCADWWVRDYRESLTFMFR